MLVCKYSHTVRLVLKMIGPLDNRLELEISFGDDLTTGSDEETEMSELQYLWRDIHHIIECLYRISTTLNNPVPRERLAKLAAIDVSHFKTREVEHMRHKFPKAPEYLIQRLGEANCKRRQLLQYYKDNHNKIIRYIDLPLPLPAADTGDKDNVIASSKSPATVPTAPQSQATAIRPEDIVLEELGSDDDLSETVYATSTHEHINIQVLPPPNLGAAFRGEPFQCPYCCQIMKVDTLHSWR